MEIEVLERTLRARGARLTPHRRAILRAIARLDGHITATRVYALVAALSPSIDVSTVYRTLEMLHERRLLQRSYTHDGVARYHHENVPPHQHLICRDCGQEQTIDLDGIKLLAQTLRERFDFHPDPAYFALTGRCRACATPTDTAPVIRGASGRPNPAAE